MIEPLDRFFTPLPIESVFEEANIAISSLLGSNFCSNIVSCLIVCLPLFNCTFPVSTSISSSTKSLPTLPPSPSDTATTCPADDDDGTPEEVATTFPSVSDSGSRYGVEQSNIIAAAHTSYPIILSIAQCGNCTLNGMNQCQDTFGCSPPNTSLNSVDTGAYSSGCDTSPDRVFKRAILDIFVLIASDCSMSMQNVKKKNRSVIMPRMSTIGNWLALQPAGRGCCCWP